MHIKTTNSVHILLVLLFQPKCTKVSGNTDGVVFIFIKRIYKSSFLCKFVVVFYFFSNYYENQACL